MSKAGAGGLLRHPDLSQEALDFGPQPAGLGREFAAGIKDGIRDLAGFGRGIGNLRHACRNLTRAFRRGVGASGDLFADRILLLNRDRNIVGVLVELPDRSGDRLHRLNHARCRPLD